MSMTEIVRIALHKKSNKFIHVDNAENGLACDCECLKCGERLEAIQGEIRTKHFRHHTNKDCEGSQETALHELGKQILIENTHINIPQYGDVSYTEAIAEKRFEKIRPDVTAIYEGKNIYFEIFVSHLVDEKKDAYIKDKMLRCIEIDLSECRKSSYEEICNEVLERLENKRIIYWDAKESSTTNQDNTGCLLQLLLLFMILLGFSWILREK